MCGQLLNHHKKLYEVIVINIQFSDEETEASKCQNGIQTQIHLTPKFCFQYVMLSLSSNKIYLNLITSSSQTSVFFPFLSSLSSSSSSSSLPSASLSPPFLLRLYPAVGVADACCSSPRSMPPEVSLLPAFLA